MPSLPLSAPSAANIGLPSTPQRGFTELDDRVLSGAPGVLLARAPSTEGLTALGAHLARRVAASGLHALVLRNQRGGTLWRELAARLGQRRVPCDPEPCAEEIASALVARRTVLVAPLPKSGTWDRAVAAEIVRLVEDEARPLLLVFLTLDGDPTPDLRVETFDVGAQLDPEERRRWWTATADDAQARVAAESLVALEQWWGTAHRARILGEPPCIPSEGEGLGRALALAARAWPLAEVLRLNVEASSVEALRAAGVIQSTGGWISLDPAYDARAVALAERADADTLRAVAGALVGVFEEDLWAHARAAELWLRAGAAEDAERAHEAAVLGTESALARRELMARWADAVDAVSRAEQLPLRMRAAERALSLGDAEEAHRWGQSAAALAPAEDPRLALLLGRTALALGDLVAARIAFERAREHTQGADEAARFAAELSEVAYLATDLPRAEEEARTALATGILTVRLKARNTLGKLLLSDSRWDEAERHFAEDAIVAASHGLVVEELRARMNRGIALLSKSLYDEARTVFDEVLAEGERRGETRACAFALENLAVIATLRHDYSAALSLDERALKLRQKQGDRYSIAVILGNLAELRSRLGLFQHAEHAIAFGRRTLGPGMPTEIAATFSCLAARIALARGNMAEARRESARAISDSQAAKVQSFVGEAYRGAARIALEDGDLPRASHALQQAREHATTDLARAEVALLDALLARASGQADAQTAHEALALARLAGHEELLIESHTLLCEIERAEDRGDAARAHLNAAMAVRDQIAIQLKDDVRAAFLARPSVVALGHLQELLRDTAPTSRESPARPDRGRADGVTAGGREIVGNDPAIRALLVAIKRVARSSATILIRGESGTGKELVAEAIHRASDRADGPLVTVNCAALVETLLLSELFGHEKGAFTGALARRRGRFELAEHGTLFLDEIGDISARTQVALLRVLQEKTFERVGGAAPMHADVRILCATHRDLRAMVERGEFREDLYYRLRGITLELPPLRQRLGDLPRIGEHLLARIAAERQETPKILSPDALELLTRHHWPGNIRELENVLRAASLFCEGRVINAACLLENVDDLRLLAHGRVWLASSPESGDDGDDTGDAPLPVGEASATAVAYNQVRQGVLSLADMKRQIERDCVARALAETKGNITRAAALLGMKRPRLSQLVKQYGLAAVSSEASQ